MVRRAVERYSDNRRLAAAKAVYFGTPSPADTPPPRSGARHPSRRDCWYASDPKGAGAGVRKHTRPRTRTRPSDWGVASVTARAPRTPRAHGAAGPKDIAVPADSREGRCASRDGTSAHRPPVSFARSSTAVSGRHPDLGESCVVRLPTGPKTPEMRPLSASTPRVPLWFRRPRRRKTCGCRRPRSGGPHRSPCIGRQAMQSGVSMPVQDQTAHRIHRRALRVNAAIRPPLESLG